MSHRVLVTAVGGNVGQGVVKALRAGARSYAITGTDMEPRSAGFAMVDAAVVMPPAADPAFAAAMAEVVVRERIEAIFVCSPAELPFFLRERPALEAGTGVRVLLNPAEVIRIGRDKLETARFLDALGFASPQTARADDEPAVDDLIARWGFPVIAKPRYGASSVNVFVLDSRAAIAAARTLVPDLILQRYLPDSREELTAGVVGSAAAKSFARIVLRRDLLQGTTYRTELVEDAAVEEQIVAMAQALGVEGACNFQLRLSDGQPLVFEINPRLSGTSGIRYLYGFNDPELWFELACLGLPVTQPALSPAVVLRYWNEVYYPGATFRSLGDSTAAAGRPIALPAPRGLTR